MNEKNAVTRAPWLRPRRLAVACLAAMSALAAGGVALADPPTSVVRLAYADGPLSFAPAGENDWVSATVNRPLVTGDRLWADAGARADLRLSRSLLHVGANTSLTLLNADDRTTQLRLDEGTLDLNVKQIDANHALEVDTPNLAYSISQPGVYRIDVDPQGTRTSISVHSGSGQVYAGNQAFVIKAGQVYDFRGNTLADYDTHALAPPDDFDRWAIARDQRWEHAASARYVPPEMIGSEDLDDYGQWHNEAQYGAVWTPQHVAADWAPYRDGHWAWVDPWGWTWIDDAPWGFAPSHYGRWARFDAGWGWVPGPARVQPVYAPAVVQFVGGVDSRSALTIAGVAAVAWFALAPHEVYRPPYTVSRGYMNRVNTSNTIVNTTVINNYYRTGNDDRRGAADRTRQPEPRQHFANQQVRGGVVAVPSANFAQAQPVGHRALAVTAQAVAAAPVVATAHVAPVRESVLGNASPAHGRPPEAAMNRAVIARTAPPPAMRPFAERQAALAQHPGRPADVAVGRPQGGAAPGAAPAARQQAAPAAPVIAAATPAKLRPMPLPNRPLAKAAATLQAPAVPAAPQAALAQHPPVQPQAAPAISLQQPPVQAQAGDPRGREARPGPEGRPNPVAATPAPAPVATAQAQREAAQARAVQRPQTSPSAQPARPAVEAQQAQARQEQRQPQREQQARPERPAANAAAHREPPVAAAHPAPAAPRPAERAPVAAAPRPAAPPPERHAEQPRPEIHARPAEHPQERPQEHPQPQPQQHGQGRDEHGKG